MEMSVFLDFDVEKSEEKGVKDVIRINKISINSEENAVIFSEKSVVISEKADSILEKKVEKFIEKLPKGTKFCTYMVWGSIGKGYPLDRKTSIKLGKFIKKNPLIREHKPSHFKGYGTQRAFIKYDLSDFEI